MRKITIMSIGVLLIGLAVSNLGGNEEITRSKYNPQEHKLTQDVYKIEEVEENETGKIYRGRSLENNYVVGIHESETQEQLTIGDKVSTISSCQLGHIKVDLLGGETND